MSLKKLKLSMTSGKKPVDPLEIFKKLTLRGSIENIWEPQAEALKNWHKVRADSDAVIQMNTGGGKTLVGLLTAQSLLNELNRRVLYVVANNQLVEQTLSRATELSLPSSARYGGQWHNQESFQSAEAICVTNYAAVFNGFSTFRDKDIAALIFDDAHVAESLIRDQFTLKISSEWELYDKIVSMYRPHFANSIGASKLQDIEDESPTALLFVPMFVVWKHAQELRTLLLDGGVDQDDETKFVWNHISEHLSHCCVLISSDGIEISPPVVPLKSLPFFAEDVRRVYLTATLPSQASFARTFGLTEPTLVTPGGKSGDAQRLVLFTKGKTDEVQRRSTLEMIDGQKACVISPSTGKANQWSPPSVVFKRTDGHEEIERFSQSKRPEVLGLVARYDGIDLPGDACRILVLDRLPKGELVFERFLDEGVRMESLRLHHAATRIVQAIGRIFRSNTDHGAVLLVGTDLHDWIRNPSNRSFLPPLLQQQIALGIELDKQVAAGKVTQSELLDGVLTGSDEWDELYSDNIDDYEPTSPKVKDDWYPEMLVSEREAYGAMWNGDYSTAIQRYSELAEESDSKERRLGAWYRHLEGVAHLHAGDQTTALQSFASAAAQRIELGRPSEQRDKMFKPPKVDTVGIQAKALAGQYRKNRTKMLNSIGTVISDLDYGDDTKSAESAFQILGKLLGLDSTRPDKDQKTGPDNLWCSSGEIEAWGFDLKTGKEKSSEYTKDEVGRAHLHAQWLADEKKDAVRKHAIVGYELPVSNLASPSPELEIIDLAGFQEIASRVQKMLDSVEAGSKDDLEAAFEAWLRHFGLLWPDCVLALASRRAIDLKAD
ncbi:MAG: DEAD/DEAH box helicase family protein [Planctomycetaceae bacterium]|nr:DEAD/DEAH box helicase family protein [Planctomycetaceae bacterium]